MLLSQRIQAVQPSPTLAIQAKAKALKAAGERVLSLAAGEPDFPTPEHIREACIRALQAGHTGYTPSAGIPELRAAVRRRFQSDLDLRYEDNEVTVCCGAKQCLFNAFMSSLDPGSEAIVQAPYWVSYPEMVRLCGAQPVILPPPPPGQAFNLAALASAITPRTRVVVLNSPCNPSGQIVQEAELLEIARLALQHSLLVVSDDIYDRLIYDGRRFSSIVALQPRLRSQAVLVNGVSKAYSMTGWRLGYAVGPADLIGAMRKVQDQSTSNATTFVQHAAIEALASPPEVVGRMVRSFEQRRGRMVELLSRIPGVQCEKPAGTFYCFPSFAGVVGRRFEGQLVDSTLKLAELLLDQCRVAVIPGEAFGSPGFLRFSFAAALEVIEEGCEKVRTFVEALA
jgi:aspartate aminotransferase